MPEPFMRNSKGVGSKRESSVIPLATGHRERAAGISGRAGCA
jgi:hypothetical protein